MNTFIIFSLSIIGFSNAVIITIPELGDVQGVVTNSAWTDRPIYQFLGIRYALPPSGSRRFLPPEPVPAWNNIYDATTHKQSCPQITKMDELLSRPEGTDVEDCLTLNVFTPKIPENTSELLPVMVYIHGGGYFEGNSKEFPPDYLLEHDVLLVVPQYRLGPLGFLSLETDEVSGNMGLLDQVLALRWVNKNIKSFGGDNTQVTLFGQSAGACSISFHLVSPNVEPYLFQKAIIQSGSSYAGWALDKHPLKVARSIYKFITNASDPVDVEDIEKKFKSMSVLDLFKATIMNKRATNIPNGLVTRAVVQKAGKIKYLTKKPMDYVISGNYRTVPMIAGVTKHDGTYMATLAYDLLETFGAQDNDDFLRNNLTAFSLQTMDIEEDTGSLVDILNNKYFKNAYDKSTRLTFGDIANGLADMLGVFMIKGQTLKQAKINLNYQPNNTYVYTFEYRGEHTRFGYGADTSKYPFGGGVSHSNDLLYLFPYHYNPPLNHEDTKIAKLMTDLWANFAINTKPTSSHMKVEWPPLIRNKNGPFLHINASSYLGDDFVITEYMAISNEEIN